MGRRRHEVVIHRSGLAEVQAFTLRTDHAFPRHSHEGFGIGLMTSGAQRSWSGIGWVEARRGDLITVNPGELHDGAPLGGPRGWRIVYVGSPRVDSLMAEEGLDAPTIARPAIRDPHLALRFDRLFARIRLAGLAGGGEALAIETELLRTLAHLLHHHGDRPGLPEPGSPAVSLARQRLDDAPAEPVSLAELAQQARVSRFQLLRGFAREVGTTPHAYQLQRRVSLARRLLDAGTRPAEAALGAGFADQSHLTRAFRRQFGVTPARYRASRG